MKKKIKIKIMKILVLCMILSAVFGMQPWISASASPTYSSTQSTFNTKYGPLTISACEGSSIIELDQNTNVTWYLKGYFPNNIVNPDLVYLTYTIEFLDVSQAVLTSVSTHSGKEVSFSVPYPDLYNEWYIIRQLNLYATGKSSATYTFPSNVMNDTRYIRCKANYYGWWSTSHWTDENVYPMSFYTTYTPPNSVSGGSPEEQMFSFSFNQTPVLVLPAVSQIFSEADTSFTPYVTVSDVNNDSLTCSYSVDNETSVRDTKTTSNGSSQTVNFDALSLAALKQGYHLIKFVIGDGKVTVKKNMLLKIDKSPPVLQRFVVSSTDTSITVTGSATDSISGLDAAPYRYTVGTNVSSWTADISYTQNSLEPGTPYVITFEARDQKGHIISSQQKTYYTKR